VIGSAPGGLPIATDGQGRIVTGDDLERTTQQSAAHQAQTLTVASGLKRRLLQVTVHYSASVTVNVTVTLTSGAGSAWNTVLDTIALSAAQDGVSTKVIGMELAPDDSLTVTAPDGGVGVTSAVAVYAQIIGLTARAVSAAS